VTDDLPNPLRVARKLGLIGDLHGDQTHFYTVAQTMWARGISVLICLGDWSMVWPGEPWNKTLDRMSRRLAAKGQTIYVVEGNHDWIPRLHQFAQDDDGLRRLRFNVILFPRGYRTTLAPLNEATPGLTLAVLPGANSVDREYRTEGSDWWPDEAINDEDLAVLGSERADILLGHEAPLGVQEIEDEIEKNADGWSESARAYAAEGRRQFHRGFLAVRPRLSLGGHWHRHVDTILEFNDDTQRFSCRVVILDMNGADTLGQAILDTATLHLEFFTRSDSKVERLTMRDQGRWVVHTAGAALVFDLDARTVERRPRPGARQSPRGDRPLPLVGIRILHVGAVAIYTVDPLDEHVPYQDRFSSAVVDTIEREDHADR
jgi:hypothetical protein